MLAQVPPNRRSLPFIFDSRKRMHLWPRATSRVAFKTRPASPRLSLPLRDPRSRARGRMMIGGPNDHVQPHSAHGRARTDLQLTRRPQSTEHTACCLTHSRSVRAPARRTRSKCIADADLAALGHWREQIAVLQCAAGCRSASATRGLRQGSSRLNARARDPATPLTAHQPGWTGDSAAKLTCAPRSDPHSAPGVRATHEVRVAAG